MKKLFSLMTMALLIVAVIPVVFGAGVGTGVGGDIEVESFKPIVWQCNDRVLVDEEMQPWRISPDGKELSERNQHYIFDGEKYSVDVVVFDKNKVEDLQVDLILGESAGDVDFNINCVRNAHEFLDSRRFSSCNARIDEEKIDQFDSDTMMGYTCTITALDSEHMYGEYWMAVQAEDPNDPDRVGIYDETAKWFFNPFISLNIEGDLFFEDVRPGTSSYSTILIQNEAEGGVLLDMFVTGKDWQAADPNLGRCFDPLTGDLENYLSLGAFSYYTENGAYTTRDDMTVDTGYSSVKRAKDEEGYVNINYQTNAGFEEAMFNDAEILQAGTLINGAGYSANVLYPGSSGMSMTLRLDLPEPCYGNFESASEGSIFIWGEAI